MDAYNLIAANKNIAELAEAGKMARNLPAPENCKVFTRAINRVHCAVSNFKNIADATLEHSQEIGEKLEAVRLLDHLCDLACVEISKWLNVFPQCGTTELHNEVLDIKNWAMKMDEKLSEGLEIPPELDEAMARIERGELEDFDLGFNARKHLLQ